MNFMMMFGLPGLVVIGGFMVAMCIHVVRTGREMFWLWIIFIGIPPLGALVYFFVAVAPDLFRGPTARKVSRAARETLDPWRDYREARADHDLTPSVHNQMRLAAAAAELGRHEEAEDLYREAMQGVHADDPALLLGRAKALIELDRPADALPLLERLGQQGKEGQTPQAMLALARTYEGVGRVDEAAQAYDWTAPRLPGLEGVARQAAFLARHGRKAQAQEALAEIDRRLSRANPHFRKEGRAWRDLAAQAIEQG